MDLAKFKGFNRGIVMAPINIIDIFFHFELPFGTVAEALLDTICYHFYIFFYNITHLSPLEMGGGIWIPDGPGPPDSEPSPLSLLTVELLAPPKLLEPDCEDDVDLTDVDFVENFFPKAGFTRN